MNPRIVVETDESERPTVTHAVRRATTTKVDLGHSCAYQTMCGEILVSDAKTPTRKRGIPNCLRCVIAGAEEAVSWP